MIRVRPAVAFDTRSMARLLNRIIEIGGTTAITKPVTAAGLAERLADRPDRSAWHVAVDENEEVAGFQWIAPNPSLPNGACDIATFVEVGRTGLGIGSALFEATAQAGRENGIRLDQRYHSCRQRGRSDLLPKSRLSRLEG